MLKLQYRPNQTGTFDIINKSTGEVVQTVATRYDALTVVMASGKQEKLSATGKRINGRISSRGGR